MQLASKSCGGFNRIRKYFKPTLNIFNQESLQPLYIETFTYLNTSKIETNYFIYTLTISYILE